MECIHIQPDFPSSEIVESEEVERIQRMNHQIILQLAHTNGLLRLQMCLLTPLVGSL